VENRPNILWICTDQQRFDTLGCYGNRFVRTPSIDRLAENGALFERAFCQSPVCTPSRASFLSCRYPRTCRTRGNGQEIPENEVLVPRLLRDEGRYLCGLSGKLHLSVCSTDRCHTEERRIDDGYEVFRWSHNPRRSAEGRPSGNQYRNWLQQQGVSYATSPSKHLDSPGDAADRLRGPEYWRGAPLVEAGMPEEFHQSRWCADQAIEFIEERGRDRRPWLFSVNFYDPHHPMDPPAEYLERYIPFLEDIPLPDCREEERSAMPLFHHDPIECQYHFDRMGPKEHRLVKAAYYAMIDLIDAQVGRMMEALEASGQLRSTIVVFTSDHGEMLGDHGIYLKGPYFYEPAVRVPLILSMPGTIPAGRRSSGLVELTDVGETLLSAADGRRHAGMQGRTLWPMLTGQAGLERHRDSVYCEYYNALANHADPKAYGTMVRNARYKIVRYHGIDQGELYDLRDDPGEFRNLWNEAAHAPVKIRMLELLADRMAFTMDPLPPRVAGW
jgi:arylsulfatase A-like enzyme